MMYLIVIYGLSFISFLQYYFLRWYFSRWVAFFSPNRNDSVFRPPLDTTSSVASSSSFLRFPGVRDRPWNSVFHALDPRMQFRLSISVLVPRSLHRLKVVNRECFPRRSFRCVFLSVFCPSI